MKIHILFPLFNQLPIANFESILRAEAVSVTLMGNISIQYHALVFI